MRTKRLRFRRHLAVVFAALAALGLASPAMAYSVYRAVDADANTGAVTWNAANFGVSGNPTPTLSFFYFANDAAAQAAFPTKQCFVKVDLPNTVAPAPGNQDLVGNAGIPVGANPADQPKAFPWQIDFDNNPAGHWSIPRTQITGTTSNNAASRVAAAGFHSLATTPASGVTIVNGTLGNCGP
ncbi:hypothetical protein [Ciceribacter azotifigens]|uniref:hypothetical protein n=1 Tax=Ciceribacter azotifigens TaxID=2069303 RepID=UPI003A83C571